MPHYVAASPSFLWEGSFLRATVLDLGVTTINEDELTRAVERTLVAHGKLAPDQARPTARAVLNYFGLDDTVLDNKLTSEDRDRFYQLEEEGLLTSEEEDATVSRGKTWRIHYWLMKKARIRDAGQAGTPGTDPDAAVYSQISEDAWNRSSPAGGVDSSHEDQ